MKIANAKIETAEKTENAPQASAWSPLRRPMFRFFWTAGVVSNIGTWMQTVGAAWLMTELNASATWVALIQSAASLPFFLFALPAGALADIVDKRRLLFLTQVWSLLSALVLGALTIFGLMSPALLLVFTFFIGTGAALASPALQAATPEIVPREELAPAVSLSSVSINIARAVGPALGGLIVAAAGVAASFFLNAASFLGLIGFTLVWKPKERENHLPPEHLTGAMRNAVRYALNAAPLQSVLARTAVFILGGSALWALLPVQAQQNLGLSASGYGALLGAIGAGALSGAALLPTLKEKFSVEVLVAGASIVFGAVTIALAFLANFYLLLPVMAAGGVAWVALMSSFNVATQTSAHGWVRARAIAIQLLVFQGGTAAGSFLWGAVAENFGLRTSLVAAGISIFVSVFFAFRYKLPAEKIDLSPARHWAHPELAGDFDIEDKRVTVTVEYRVASETAEEFRRAARNLRKIRRRDGAIFWTLMQDSSDPSRFVELFQTESWTEHMRQHDERFSQADLEIEELARRFHLGEKTKITHYIND